MSERIRTPTPRARELFSAAFLALRPNRRGGDAGVLKPNPPGISRTIPGGPQRVETPQFPSLTDDACAAPCPFRIPLPDGVMAAQATLTRLVMVRIHVGQPFDAPSEHGLLMACGRHTRLE